ncbi:MAG: DNA starvation/stationary phase protection protein [Deltaproteobacteria bacterium]|nr:DNA starvation/stationary phase protection protein [Deltaproteobacteria bacterium]
MEKIPKRSKVYDQYTKMCVTHLANLYALAIRLQGYHWNYTGPYFYSLHKLFEDRYKQIFKDIDRFAERIRTFGCYAPGSVYQMYKRSNATDRAQALDLNGMLEDLLTTCEIVRSHAQETLRLGVQLDDEVTVDMLTESIEKLDHSTYLISSSAPSKAVDMPESILQIVRTQEDMSDNGASTH